MKNKVNFIILLAFFIIMVTLTITARTIHNTQIPNVNVKRLTQEDFIVTQKLWNGEESYYSQKKHAIPKYIYEKGEVFAVTTIYINGEKRNGARKVYPQVGAENEEFYEVTSGIGISEFIIFDSDKELNDGDEIFIVK